MVFLKAYEEGVAAYIPEARKRKNQKLVLAPIYADKSLNYALLILKEVSCLLNKKPLP